MEKEREEIFIALSQPTISYPISVLHPRWNARLERVRGISPGQFLFLFLPLVPFPLPFFPLESPEGALFILELVIPNLLPLVREY